MATVRFEPRHRNSGKPIPNAYLVLKEAAGGIPEGPLGSLFLNDEGMPVPNPARKALAEAVRVFVAEWLDAHP